jgi:hypothetical protein
MPGGLKMQTHWIHKNNVKEEMKSLAGENYAHASMIRLMAKIERRQGRWRLQMGNRNLKEEIVTPLFPEAA